MIAPDFDWKAPPEAPVPGNSEVHVWRAPLDLTEAEVAFLQGILSEDERRRAGAFYHQRDRRRFTANRGILRMILAHYLDKEPAALNFCYGLFGKPALPPEAGRNPIHFNISHSDGMALYAVIRDRSVGIDLERIRPDFEWEDFAKWYFCPREYGALRAFPASFRRQAFFSYWTCKEAYVKATGRGLTLPLNRFEIALTAGDAADLVEVAGEPEPGRWTLLKLTPAPGYAGFLAVEGSCSRFKLWQWPRHWIAAI